MNNNIVDKLINKKEEYYSVMNDIELLINNSEKLNYEELNFLEEELNRVAIVVYNIEKTIKELNNKSFKLRALKIPSVKSKLKNKESIEFSETLLNQGKAAKAIKNLEKLAKQGEAEYQFLIGKTYLKGVIGEYGDVKMKDSGLGLKWLQIAYKNNITEAGYLIAMYEKSVLNIDKAITLFEDLTNKKHYRAMLELEKLYEFDPKYKNMTKLLNIKAKINKI